MYQSLLDIDEKLYWTRERRERRTYRDAISVFLSDAFSFSLALLKWVLVLELGTHVGCCLCKRLVGLQKLFL